MTWGHPRTETLKGISVCVYIYIYTPSLHLVIPSSNPECRRFGWFGFLPLPWLQNADDFSALMNRRFRIHEKLWHCKAFAYL